MFDIIEYKVVECRIEGDELNCYHNRQIYKKIEQVKIFFLYFLVHQYSPILPKISLYNVGNWMVVWMERLYWIGNDYTEKDLSAIIYLFEIIVASDWEVKIIFIMPQI